MSLIHNIVDVVLPKGTRRRRIVNRMNGELAYFCQATAEFLLNQRDPLVPPRRMWTTIGWGDYKQWGYEMLGHFTRLGRLQPDMRVLEIGSGLGRMAVPLTRFLETGSYDGLDITASAIQWCQTHITPRHPNFRFHHFDVYNASYNPSGTMQAHELQFPFEDQSFDFVFLQSVFTHMFPDDVDQYLSEIARVLKSNGRCLATWFLLNQISRDTMVRKKGPIMPLSFDYEVDGYETCRSIDPVKYEIGISHEEQVVRDLYAKHNLGNVDVHYGCWCGRYPYLSYQDIVIVTKFS